MNAHTERNWYAFFFLCFFFRIRKYSLSGSVAIRFRNRDARSNESGKSPEADPARAHRPQRYKLAPSAVRDASVYYALFIAAAHTIAYPTRIVTLHSLPSFQRRSARTDSVPSSRWRKRCVNKSFSYACNASGRGIRVRNSEVRGLFQVETNEYIETSKYNRMSHMCVNRL